MQPAQPLRSATSSTTSPIHQASNPDQIMNAHPASEASEALSLTPDKSHTEDRKRKRDVLSCLDCRRRKLKCDRGYPSCIRCQKGGNASSCTYASFPGESSGNGDDLDEQVGEDGRVAKRPRGAINGNQSLRRDLPSPSIPTNSSQTETIIRLEERLKTLESIVSQSFNRERSPAAVPMRTSVVKPMDVKPKEPETNFFKGRGVRTQFHGASCPTSILAHFPEVRAFMQDAHPNSALARLQDECKAMEGLAKGKKAKNLPRPAVELVDLVPERSIVDPLVKNYFNTFEKTFRILHEPTFWNDYEEFWKSPRDAKPGFHVILLLVLAAARSTSRKSDSDSSPTRAQAITWIHACDHWLSQQSQKHRFLGMYQVMILRFLGALANSLKNKAAYTEIEAVFTYFKAAGFHRDPSLLEERCSLFEREMRRRLWATVSELELQTSIDKGFSSSLAAMPVDCRPPVNANDEDLFVGSSLPPAPKPPSQYTSTSYLKISSESLALRVSLCALINDPKTHLEYDLVLQYEQQIQEALDALPQWTDWTDKGHTQASFLIDLQLRQFLLLIHTPFARRSTTSHRRYSRLVCLSTSKTILDIHSKLIAAGNYTLTLIREDAFRAALSICHNTFLCTLKPADIFFSGFLAGFQRMLDDTFKILEERCMRRGIGYHQFWYISAACSLVQTKLDPETAMTLRLLATERVYNLYRKGLETFEQPKELGSLLKGRGLSSVNQAGGGLNLADTPAGSWFFTANTLGFTQNEQGLGDAGMGFDASDWTLDDLWPLDDNAALF